MQIVFFLLISISMFGCSFKKNATENKEPAVHSTTMAKSILVENINIDQQQLLHLVGIGTANDISQFLNSHPKLDVNFKSIEGNSPLSTAIKRKDQEIVNVLLNSGALPFRYMNHLFSDISYWYSRTILEKYQDTAKYYSWPEIKGTWDDSESGKFLAKSYVTFVEDLGIALKSKDIEKIRSFHIASNLSCDQFADIGIKAIEFQSYELPIDEKVSLFSKYYQTTACPRQTNSIYGSFLYKKEWQRLILMNYDSPKVLGLIASLFVISDYEISFGEINSDHLKFNPYILIAPQSQEIQNNFKKEFFNKFSAPTELLIKKCVNDKEKDFILKTPEEIHDNANFIESCIMSPNKQCDYLDYQRYYDHNHDLDELYDVLNKQD